MELEKQREKEARYHCSGRRLVDLMSRTGLKYLTGLTSGNLVNLSSHTHTTSLACKYVILLAIHFGLSDLGC